MNIIIFDTDPSACLRIRNHLSRAIGTALVQFAYSLEDLNAPANEETLIVVGDGLAPDLRWKAIESLSYAARSASFAVIAYISGEADAERSLAIRAGAHGVIAAGAISSRPFEEAMKNARRHSRVPVREVIASLPWLLERVATTVEQSSVAAYPDRRRLMLSVLEKV
ncbi:MAG: hypothetical protein IT290_03510 [Deltaproteobacteria bacterium]|nr:hypothetical protein [Deltaproteobacteria bacterium]